MEARISQGPLRGKQENAKKTWPGFLEFFQNLSSFCLKKSPRSLTPFALFVKEGASTLHKPPPFFLAPLPRPLSLPRHFMRDSPTRRMGSYERFQDSVRPSLLKETAPPA